MKKLSFLFLLLTLPVCVTLAQKQKSSGKKTTTEKPTETEKKPTKQKAKEAAPTDEEVIREMLGNQVKQWNKGSIDGYMAGYWDNDSMLFIGAKGPRYGFQKTLERYREAYPDKDHMGRLTSTVTRMQALSKEYYFVVGTWALQRKAGDVGGSFTLLLRKIDGQWVIVCDHSS
jgi:hypothetical protein